MFHRFWLFVLVWFLSLSAVFGQADSSFVYIQGQLINAETGEVVPYAHILLQSKSMGLTSDDDGHFDTPLPIKDSLIITSIGFEEKHLAVKDMRLDSSINIIPLSPKVYMLSEVKITQYPTYEELVKAITNPVFTEDEKKILRARSRMNEAGLTYNDRERRRSGGGGSPISVIYNLFSRENKNRRTYEKLIEYDNVKKQSSKRVNAKVIENLTGLTDSTTISQFIKYCSISDYFIDGSSDYELYFLILEKFKTFQEKD